MTVLLFARARDLVGADHVDITGDRPATVAQLRRHLAQRFPALMGLLEKSAVAVNEEIADDQTPLDADAEVALLPPVSGG